MKKIFSFLILLFGVLLFSGCGNQNSLVNNNQNSPVSTDAGQAKTEVIISNFSFSPVSLEIKTGDAVTWINQDSASHQVVADSTNDLPNPASPVLNNGDKFSFTFSKVGTFHYHCSIHPAMKGTIIVK